VLVAAEPRSEVRHAKPCLELLGDLHRLYLIHQPIVFAIALALRDNNTLLLLHVTAVPASLLAAEILWRLVERHAIVLSLRVAGLAWPGGPSRAGRWFSR
jgi:peptidoglycan/LPS O-acetylase OafA/YrhL